MKAAQREAITKHGNNLITLFNLPEQDPMELCRKLHRIELKAHRFAEDLCNGIIDLEDDATDAATDKILNSVDALLHFRTLGIPVFVNLDPRGCALKVDHTYKTNYLPQDWGGYGLLAPEIN